MYGGRSGGTRGPPSKSPLLAESRWARGIPPAVSCDSTCRPEKSSRDRTGHQSVHWGLVTQATPAPRVPNYRTSGNHVACTQSLGTVSPSCQLGRGGGPAPRPTKLGFRCQPGVQLLSEIAKENSLWSAVASALSTVLGSTVCSCFALLRVCYCF